MNKQIAILKRTSVVQRAFQITKIGSVADVSSLQEKLSMEGYLNSFHALAGRSVTQQLARMIFEARRPHTRRPVAPSECRRELLRHLEVAIWAGFGTS